MTEETQRMTAEALEPLAGRALKFLHSQAEAHAQARANADYMDAWVKAEKARIKGLVIGQSNAAAEDEAQRHPAFLAALQAQKEANTAHYTNQFKREAASAAIEAWRTACSNARANV